MNDVQIFDGLKVKEDNGQALFDAETVAIGLGISRVATSGNEVVRWERVNKYLGDSCPDVGTGDWITEPQFYRLAIKANNKTAEKFQLWVTDEVLPTIRKTGSFQMQPMTPMEMMETQFEILKEVKAENAELKTEFVELKETFGLPSVYAKRFTKARNRRVIDVMGGYHGQAYNNKKVRGAVYKEMANIIKGHFMVDEYASIPLSRFEEANQMVNSWTPSEVLQLAIDGSNAQTNLEV